MRKENTIILLFIIITLTLGYLFYLSFIFTKNRCCRKIDQLFIKTIQIDQNKRNEETNTSYSIGSSIAITTDKSASNQRSSSKKYIIKNGYAEISNDTKSSDLIATDEKTYLKLNCNDGFFHITAIQPEGKKEMDIVSFFNGNKI